MASGAGIVIRIVSAGSWVGCNSCGMEPTDIVQQKFTGMAEQTLQRAV